MLPSAARWPTARRHSFYRDDHIYLTAFFLEPRGRDLETYQPVKLQPACPSLLEEGYANQIKAISSVQSWWLFRSSARLPVSGSVARVALRGVVRLDAAIVSEAGAFLVDGGLVYIFPKRRPSDSSCRTYCGYSLFPQSQTGSREPPKSDGARLWELRG